MWVQLQWGTPPQPAFPGWTETTSTTKSISISKTACWKLLFALPVPGKITSFLPSSHRQFLQTLLSNKSKGWFSCCCFLLKIPVWKPAVPTLLSGWDPALQKLIFTILQLKTLRDCRQELEQSLDADSCQVYGCIPKQVVSALCRMLLLSLRARLCKNNSRSLP